MQEASNAQTDREWMMQINGNVGRLTDSVERLATIVEKLEERRLEPIEEDIVELKQWRSEFKGSYRTLNIIVIGLTIASLVYTFLK